MNVIDLLIILEFDRPSGVMWAQQDSLFELIPEIKVLSNLAINGKSVFYEILNILDNLPNNPEVRFAALFEFTGMIAPKKQYSKLSEKIFNDFALKNSLSHKFILETLKYIHYHSIDVSSLDEDDLYIFKKIFTPEQAKALMQLKEMNEPITKFVGDVDFIKDLYHLDKISTKVG